jgi:diaminopimelate epimerase
MRFAKGHGTENDFVILLDPGGQEGLSRALAARLCDRRAGIGADGVLRAVRTAAMAEGAGTGVAGSDSAGSGSAGSGSAGSCVPGVGAEPGAEWFMDYRNADGSVAEMCGNGLRVFAWYLAKHGLTEDEEFTVETRSGPRQVRLHGPGGEGGVTVNMGRVEVLGPGSAVIGGQAYQGLRVSIGNPHLVCLVDAPLSSFDLSRPPSLDPGQFPDGGNVELVQVIGPRSVAMRVYERGSGETRSCGTGAVAAAAAAAAAAPTETGQEWDPWSVTVPGGELTVTLDADRAWLTGPAVIVAEGDLDPDWLAAH